MAYIGLFILLVVVQFVLIVRLVHRRNYNWFLDGEPPIFSPFIVSFVITLAVSTIFIYPALQNGATKTLMRDGQVVTRLGAFDASDKAISGSFFLLAGSVDTQDRYAYLVEVAPNRYKKETISSDEAADVFIEETTGTPCVVKQFKETRQVAVRKFNWVMKTLFWLDDTETGWSRDNMTYPTFIFRVPKGTVLGNYKF